jgi:UPF0716 protein FxsA
VLGKLLLLFTVIPVVELYLLIAIGQRVGAGPTIALVLVTGFIGAGLAKREGARVLRTWQESMARGEIPKEGVISGVLVLLGGVLLVTPGVLSDVAGLGLLLPWTRRLVANVVRKRLEQRFSVQGLIADPSVLMGAGFMGGGTGMGGPGGTVIDVDVVEPPPADEGEAPLVPRRDASGA